MKTAAIAKLKASLSDYLRYVREGEDVVVTDRGKPVAMIVPYASSHDHTEHECDLIRRGLMKPSKGPLDVEFFKHPKVKDPEGLLLKALLEERESGR